MNTKTAFRRGLQQICVVAFLLGVSFYLVRLELPSRHCPLCDSVVVFDRMESTRQALDSQP